MAYNLRKRHAAKPIVVDDSSSSVSEKQEEEAAPAHESIDSVSSGSNSQHESSSSAASNESSTSREDVPPEQRERFERALEEADRMHVKAHGLRSTCTYLIESGAFLYRVRQRVAGTTAQQRQYQWDCDCEDAERNRPRSCKHIYFVQRTMLGGNHVPRGRQDQAALWAAMEQRESTRSGAEVLNTLTRGRMIWRQKRPRITVVG
jgi:hypothetical protein